MKTLKTSLVAFAIAVTAVSASAQHRYGGYENSGERDRNLGIGLIVGALGASAIYQNRQPVYVEQPPVVVAPPPVVYYPAPPVYVEQPPVVYLQDGTRLTYSYRSGLWVDNHGRAYNLPR